MVDNKRGASRNLFCSGGGVECWDSSDVTIRNVILIYYVQERAENDIYWRPEKGVEYGEDVRVFLAPTAE